jgi:hypothetical protein
MLPSARLDSSFAASGLAREVESGSSERNTKACVPLFSSGDQEPGVSCLIAGDEFGGFWKPRFVAGLMQTVS